MRYFNAFAVTASLLVVSWGTPVLQAKDDPARLEQIMDRVSESLEDSELSDQAKQRALSGLRERLAAALRAEEQEQAAKETPEEVRESKPADAAEETPGRRLPRAAQREQRREQRGERGEQREPRREMRERGEQRETQRETGEPRRELGREAIAEARRRAEEMRRQSQRSQRGPGRPQDPRAERFAIGVMLERTEEGADEAGLMISEVFDDSPADEAGLEEGDVILKVDGRRITDPNEMTRQVRRAGIEDRSLSLEISRDDDVLTVEVTPTSQPLDERSFGFGRWDRPFPPGMLGGGRGFSGPMPLTPSQAPGPREIRGLQEQVEMLRKEIEELQDLVREAIKSRDRESAND